MPPVIAHVPHNNLSMTKVRATEQCKRLCGDQSNYRLFTRGYQPWPVVQTEKGPAVNSNERPRGDSVKGNLDHATAVAEPGGRIPDALLTLCTLNEPSSR